MGTEGHKADGHTPRTHTCPQSWPRVYGVPTDPAVGRGINTDQICPQWAHSFPMTGRCIRSAGKFWSAVGVLVWSGDPEGNKEDAHQGTGGGWVQTGAPEGGTSTGHVWQWKQEQERSQSGQSRGRQEEGTGAPPPCRSHCCRPLRRSRVLPGGPGPHRPDQLCPRLSPAGLGGTGLDGNRWSLGWGVAFGAPQSP